MSDDAQRSAHNAQRSTPNAPRPTGAGSEATEGIHNADGERSESDNTGLDGKSTKPGADRAGSEPIESHDTEHRSKYGGGSRREDGDGQRTP
jgi:hypothetical protein